MFFLGWVTNGTGILPNLTLGVNINQRAIETYSDLKNYYITNNWSFVSGSTVIPIDTFFSGTYP
jgi:hypothetical protein